MNQIIQFAATEAHTESQSLFEALGINVQLLIVQVVSFLILLAILRKFVYPTLIKAIDDRQAKIEASTKAAETAQAKAEKAEADVEKAFKQARKEADAVLETAHKEAAVMLETAETKAKKRAEHIVSEARSQLDQDILAAREALRKDTRELVAMATEKIVREKIDATKDAALIDRAIQEAR